MDRKDCDSLPGRFRAPRASVTLSVITALVVGGLTSPATGAVVRMWPKTVVDRQEIRVGDVAQVYRAEPDQADRFGAVVIRPAPDPGKAADVSLQELREALVQAGANPVEFTLCGSVRCHVVRPLTLRVADQTPGQAAPSRWWWPGAPSNRDRRDDGPTPAPRPGEIVVTDGGEGEVPQTLEDVLREFVAAKLVNLGGRPHLRFSPNVRKALSLARPEYDFRIHWRSERRLGPCNLEVDILQGGEVTQTLPMIVEVSLTVPVVVAAKPINRGQVVRTQDVQLEDRDFFHLDRMGLTDLAPVVGQQTRRFVRKGELIRNRDLKPRPLVNRGDLITVWSKVGGLRVKTVGKAMSPGMFGETIDVRNEASGQTFRVTVTGPQTAELARSTRQVTMAVSGKGENR